MPATLLTKITMLLALLVGFWLMQLGKAGFWAGIVIAAQRNADRAVGHTGLESTYSK